MKTKQILFTKPYTAELVETDVGVLDDNQVLVETEFSSISCGTEKANYVGDPNVSIGPKTNNVIFPRISGYSSSGRVIAKGKNITSVEIGDAVAMTWSHHQKINRMDESNVIKFNPDKISMEEAALCYIGVFPMAAIRKTKLEVGESMLVMGQGILGLLAVIFAKASGAVPVIAVDPVKERREKALQFGADYALDPTEENFVTKVRELTNGGANTAVEVTGLGIGLNQCLDCMARFGRVALLGCTRDENFTVDYYRKVHGPGIQLIGAHTCARPDLESHPGYFTKNDDVKAILKLIEYKRINLKDIIDEAHLPEDCSNVYDRLVNDKKFPVVSQFDWRGISYEKN